MRLDKQKLERTTFFFFFYTFVDLHRNIMSYSRKSEYRRSDTSSSMTSSSMTSSSMTSSDSSDSEMRAELEKLAFRRAEIKRDYKEKRDKSNKKTGKRGASSTSSANKRRHHHDGRTLKRGDDLSCAVSTSLDLFGSRTITGSDLVGYKAVYVHIAGKQIMGCAAILTLQIPAHERVIGDLGPVAWQTKGLTDWAKYVTAQAQTIGIQFVGDRNEVMRILAEYIKDPKRVELLSGHGSGTTAWDLNKTTRIKSSNKNLTMCCNGLHFVKKPHMSSQYWGYGVNNDDGKSVVSCKLTLQSPLVRALA
jgi:hypothetical protein